jgi:hypothetical protein
VARARHKHVLRTKKSVRRRRMVRVGLPVGTVLALANPAAGVVWPDEQQVRDVPVIKAAAVSVRPSPVPMRVQPLTRTEGRVRLVEKAPQVEDHKFATAPLNARTRPSDEAPVHDVLARASKVPVTGRSRGGWAEVVLGEDTYWVHQAYLAERKPTPEPSPTPSATPTADAAATAGASPTPSAESSTGAAGLSTAPCPTGSGVEDGLVQNAIDVHRAVCAAFPAVASYGGLRPGDPGEHGTGHALDIMIPDSATGDQISEWARSHASELGISQVIWAQHIWTVERSSEGWRLMEDRGSATANHYDHVHVTVY